MHVEKGMKDGQKITFAGESNQQPGMPAGDVIIVLDEKEHPVFKRHDGDLITEQVGLGGYVWRGGGYDSCCVVLAVMVVASDIRISRAV